MTRCFSPKSDFEENCTQAAGTYAGHCVPAFSKDFKKGKDMKIRNYLLAISILVMLGGVSIWGETADKFTSDTLNYSWDSSIYSSEMRNGFPELSKESEEGTWTFAILDWTDGMPESLPEYTINTAKEYYIEKDPAFPEAVFLAMQQNKPEGFAECNSVSTGVYYKGDTEGVFSHVYGISGSKHTFVLALTFNGSKEDTKDLHDRNYEGNDDLIEKELADVLNTLEFADAEEYENIEQVDVLGAVG